MKKYNVLIIEDDADDVELIKLELAKLDIGLDFEVVETHAGLQELLKSVKPDIVISDFNLPGFTGLDALKMVREQDPDLPFILCSGFIGEEKAVDAMREGVNDYILKNSMGRLGIAVSRELKHYELRKKRRIDEQLIDATFNASGLSVAIIDKDGNFTKVNKRFAELSGYSREELIGLPYARLNEDDKIEEADTVIQRILSEGGSHTNEWKLVRKDGSVRYVQSTISRLRDSGFGDHIISYVQDITERKRLKAIREQTEYVTNVGGWELDLILDRVYCNGVVLDIFQLPDGLELTVDDLLEKLDPESHKIFEEAVKKTMNDGLSFNHLLQTVEMDGEKRWVRVTGVPQQVDGRTVRIYGTFLDVTDQERKKEEIRKLSLVASKTHNGVIIFNDEAKIEWVNESFLNATGYKFEEFAGTTVGDVLSGEETDPETIKRAKQNFIQRIPFKEEMLVYTKEDEKKWFELDVTPVFDETNKKHKYVGIQEDITQRKQLEKERKEALSNLQERVKEQACLYNISSLEAASIEDLLESALDYIPDGWQYPEITATSLEFDGKTYQSDNYTDTDWKLTVERRCLNGSKLKISVVYLEEMAESDEGPFIKEELQLIESIGDHLTLAINQLIGERELLEKERRLDKMSQLSRVGYWEVDLVNNKVIQSPMTKRIHEVDQDFELNLEDAINFYPEGEPRETITRAVTEAIENGTPFDVELPFVTAEGNSIWVRAIGEAHFEDGECTRLSGSFQDIDKRKRAQIASERNRLLLETISKQAEAPIWVHDSDNRYLFVNHQWKKIFNLEDREIIGKTIFEVFDEPMATEFHEKDRKVLDTNRSLIFEERVVTPQGERYYLTTRFPMSGIPGVGRGVGGVGTDITERKEMEDELKFHSQLLDEIGEAVITVDPDGEIIYWNRAAEEIYGWAESEALGENVVDITPTMTSREQATEIFASLQKGESWSGEFKVRRKDGSEFAAAVTNTPVFDGEGNLMAIIGISSDITERKANEQRIVRSLKEKELLLGEVHHRVKNNLAIISSLISLQMEMVKDKALRFALENTRNRIHSIAMVHELLYQAENFSEIPFEEYIRNLVDAIRNTIGFENKEVKVVTEVEVDDLNINQAIPLGLMLNEIITNSLKYAFEGKKKGNILIRIIRSGRKVYVTYEDDGKGYPDDIDFNDSGSLGHTLIHTLLRQLNAEFTVDTKGKFRLEFEFEESESGSHSNM